MSTTKKKKKSASKESGKWSASVSQASDALDLKKDIFKSNDAPAIAKSLKKSATDSTRRKGTPFQSAMSMLNFYINRGGKNLSSDKRSVLDRAKAQLRKLFNKPAPR